MTSFSHSYVLGGSQHAIPNFLGRLPFVWVLLCLDVSRLRLPTVWAVEQDGSDRLREVFGFFRFIKLVDFLALFWTMRRWLATWCVPCITSFSHNYMLGGSQHAFQIFQAGCLLFAFCYVWMSPDCGTHGVGS